MKKKIMAVILSLAFVLSINSVTAFATSSSTSAGTYGTLSGSSYGGGQYIQIYTSITKAAHLYMHSTIQHNDTGAYVGTPAYYEDFGVTSLSDEIDLSHWLSSFTSNHTYAMYTTHELIGTTNYAVYTVATGTYTP